MVGGLRGGLEHVGRPVGLVGKFLVRKECVRWQSCPGAGLGWGALPAEWGVPGGGTGVLLAVPRAWAVGPGSACVLGGAGVRAVVWALSVAAHTRVSPALPRRC